MPKRTEKQSSRTAKRKAGRSLQEAGRLLREAEIAALNAQRAEYSKEGLSSDPSVERTKIRAEAVYERVLLIGVAKAVQALYDKE